MTRGYKPVNKKVYMFSLEPAEALKRGVDIARDLRDKQYKKNVKEAPIKALAEFENRMDALGFALDGKQGAVWHACYVECYNVRDYYTKEFAKLLKKYE